MEMMRMPLRAPMTVETAMIQKIALLKMTVMAGVGETPSPLPPKIGAPRVALG